MDIEENVDAPAARRTIKAVQRHCLDKKLLCHVTPFVQARELAWDAGRQMLGPLDPHLRLRLQNEACIGCFPEFATGLVRC